MASTLLDGLLAYYKLDNNINSETGKGSGSTAGGVTYGAGKIGDSAIFNGSTGYAQLSNMRDTASSTWTISGWFKTSAVGGQQLLFILSNPADNQSVIVDVNRSSGKISIATYRTVTKFVSSTKNVNDGAWHWFAYTKTGTSAVLYLDNPASAHRSGSVDNVATFSDGAKYNLGRHFGGTQYYDGALDEFGFWDRVLTIPELTELYNAGAGNTYPFGGATPNTGIRRRRILV